MEKVFLSVNCFKRKLWTGFLGCLLAVFLPLATVTHALDSHNEQDHHSDTKDCPSPEKSTDDHDSSTSNHDLFHHCHSANCFFVASGQRTSNFNPLPSASIFGAHLILARSYGIVGEDIEPPKSW